MPTTTKTKKTETPKAPALTQSTHYGTFEEWKAEATRRFGPDSMRWRFMCPVCSHIASKADYLKAGAPQDSVAFSCIGRWVKGARDAFGKCKAGEASGPCNYAGGGLFAFNPISVHADGHVHQMFAFDEKRQEGDPA